LNYDKTEMNAFVQSLYNQKMQEGKHGHYETLFHVVHAAIAQTTQTVPPHECKTDAEKLAYAAGWWKALEANRAQPVREPALKPSPKKQVAKVKPDVLKLAGIVGIKFSPEQFSGVMTAEISDIELGAFSALYKRALHSEQPPREPLTDDEITKIWLGVYEVWASGNGVIDASHIFAKAIERAHGIGGGE